MGNTKKKFNIQGRINSTTKKFEKGFGIHANGKITYDLSDKEYDKFEALVGIDSSAIQPNNNSSVTFKIIADGKTLATTNVIGYYDNLAYISVPISGVKELIIEANDGGNGNTADHCIIVNPKLTTNNGKPKITANEKFLKLGDTLDEMKDIKAYDQEDGDLTKILQLNQTTLFQIKLVDMKLYTK